MKKLYYIFISLLLGACSTFSNSEVIVRANSEKRPTKSEYMPNPEKPLKTHESEEISHMPVLAPQVGIRVPLDD